MALRMHDIRVRDSLDRLFLVAAFLVGACGTVALKLIAAPVLIVAAFPLLVLLGYVAGCFITQSLRIEPETIGDNCYYLGFLFTLTSLAVTLYQIRDVTGTGTTADDDLIPLVISGFGVALTSTIAGVFLRIILMQIRPDIVARDREARMDLTHAARDFRTSLASISRDIKTSAIEGNQRTAERNRQIEETTQKHLAESDEMMKRQANSFEASLKDFTERLSADMTRTIQREVSKAIASIVGPIEKTSDSLNRLAEAQEESEVRVRRSVDQVADSARDLGETMTLQKEAVVNAYTAMSKQADRATKSFDLQLSTLARRSEEELQASGNQRKAAQDVHNAFMRRTEEALAAISHAGISAIEASAQASARMHATSPTILQQDAQPAMSSDTTISGKDVAVPPREQEHPIQQDAPDTAPLDTTHQNRGNDQADSRRSTPEKKKRGFFSWIQETPNGGAE